MDSEKISVLTDALSRGRISRRDFLKAAVGLGVSAPAAMTLLQGCAPAPAAEPTAAPAGDTPEPAATTAPTAAPTTPPAPAKTSAIIGLAGPAKGLDPFFISSPNDLALYVTVFDSLFDLNFDTMEIVPVLVEEWEQTDDVTWSFKLKEGIQFHKGYGEMTSEDWCFWCNKIVTEKAPPYFVMGSGMITEAVPTDKYAFEVHLKEPWAAFPLTSLVSYGGVVLSKKAYEEMGPEEFAMNPIGTGSFELESWTPGGEVVMKKFEDYHDPSLPKLEEIIFQGIPDGVVRMEKMRNEEIHFTVGLNKKDMPTLREDPNLQVLDAGGWNWDYITFNLALPDRPWLDKRVRQAISYAVDRNAIVESVYYGGATAEDDSLPGGYLGADPDQQFYPNTADLDKAKALMAEAGYADGFAMPCLTSDKENLRRSLQVIADQLRQINIEVEIEQTDGGTYRSRWQNNEFETISEDAGMASPDSDSALYWWYHTSPEGGSNLGADGYSNPDVDAVLEDARKSSDSDERATLYREACEMIAEDCPKVVLCNVNEEWVLNAGLEGFYPTPQRMFPYFKGMGWKA
jgi:peptide/nickel transport system substrate-binding protein